MANDNEQAPLATQVALLRQEVGYVKEDSSEIRASLKELREDLKHLYYTKEQAANLRSELMTAHNALAGQFASWKKFVVSVGVIVVASLVLAALKLSFPGL